MSRWLTAVLAALLSCMTGKRPTILVTEGSHPTPLAWLKEQADVLEVGPDDAGFAAAPASADGMVVRSYTNVDAKLLDGAPRLKVVGRGGVGLEHIDVAACRERGIEVVYTPDANTQAVAEFVAGLMVKLVRPWHANKLAPWTNEHFKSLRKDAGEHLCDLTLGILGMGRVGHAVAKVAVHGFGMNVIYHDLLPVEPPAGTSSVALEELLQRCDLLSLHVDGRPSNAGLIDEDALTAGRFRWLINTSRGPVVDAAAVHDALHQGKLEGVALDVYDPEPPPAESGYATLLNDFPDRVILTPHMASRTKRAVENMSWVVRDVVSVATGEAAKHPVP
ncbi:MAG: NAD(P)-dependent oxidoreductase [Planctomycetota bacterium]